MDGARRRRRRRRHPLLVPLGAAACAARARNRPLSGLMRHATCLATLATLLWLLGGCHSERVTRREPPLRRAKPECPAASGDGCKDHCGPTGGAAHASSEGKCEAVLGDLCRSHCEAACGEATAT